MTPHSPNASLNQLLEHSEWLRGLARTLVRDGNEAEDVYQESLGVAMARLEQSEPGAELSRGWLAGVARTITRARRRQEVNRARRQAAAIRREGQRHGGSVSHGTALNNLELIDRQRLPLEHVRQLTEVQRDAIDLTLKS